MPDNSFDDRISLKDLDGVRVDVDEPLPRGMSGEAIRKAVESRLSAAHIRVLGLGDFPTGDPHLRVTITASEPRNGLVAVSVQLDFVQIVFLRRNPQNTFNRAGTWRASARAVLAPSSDVTRDALQELARQTDQFIADYRAANA